MCQGDGPIERRGFLGVGGVAVFTEAVFWGRVAASGRAVSMAGFLGESRFGGGGNFEGWVGYGHYNMGQLPAPHPPSTMGMGIQP